MMSGFLDFIKKQKYADYLEFFKTGAIDMNILGEMMKLLGHYILNNIYKNEDVKNLYFEDLVISPRLCYIAFYYDLEVDGDLFKVELLKISIPFGAVSKKIEDIDVVLDRYASLVLDKYRKIKSLLSVGR